MLELQYGGCTMQSPLRRHEKSIAGTISCFDRVVLMGTLTEICYAGGLAAHLSHQGIKLFDLGAALSEMA
jgi:hypothetical protein